MRRGQDLNLHRLAPTGFRDRLLTIRTPLQSQNNTKQGLVNEDFKIFEDTQPRKH